MSTDDLLIEVLLDARTRGFLGPGPVEYHVEHSRDLGEALGPFSGAFLDLGAGGGIPGLVLALMWPEATAVLLDAQQQRGAFLAHAVDRLDLAQRIVVRTGRAERLAREGELRGRFDLVVARSFGGPAETAECAVGFLAAGGRLAVTEPPESEETSERWPAAGLAELGLGPAARIRSGRAGVAVMIALDAPDHRWPRRDGRPRKSPLW